MISTLARLNLTVSSSRTHVVWCLGSGVNGRGGGNLARFSAQYLEPTFPIGGSLPALRLSDPVPWQNFDPVHPDRGSPLGPLRLLLRGVFVLVSSCTRVGVSVAYLSVSTS